MEKIKYILIQNENEDLKCIQGKVETIIKNKLDLCPYFESEIIPFKKNEEKDYFSRFKSKHFFILTNETMGDMKSENYKYINGSFILFYKGKLTAEVVTRARKTNALGIFNLDRFYGEYLEFSEIARFEEAFKKISRNILDEEVLEKNVYKEINWKVDLENEDDKEKILSLYSDEKMQSVLRKTNKIIQKVSPYYEEIIKHTDAKNINQLKKLENTVLGEENLKNIPDILKKINTKTDNLEYKKIQGILITGASGTGKTLLAEYIKDELENLTENHSRLSKVPLVNLSDNLISSELFGSYPGAFTGSSYKMGKLLSNSGGIVFLDEIGDVSMDVQTKLLTFMDDMRIIVEGYSNTEGIKIPLLLIAATNKNLKKEVQSNNFRNDLYNRFQYRIELPSLKERKTDLRFLISFVLQYTKDKNSKIDKISLKAIKKLENYNFPGNFRELESILVEAIYNAEISQRNCILEKDIYI